jgi:hypothetical protein
MPPVGDHSNSACPCKELAVENFSSVHGFTRHNLPVKTDVVVFAFPEHVLGLVLSKAEGYYSVPYELHEVRSDVVNTLLKP